MVVSGLPVRNRSEHAREIALMSLSLLDAIEGREWSDFYACEYLVRLTVNFIFTGKGNHDNVMVGRKTTNMKISIRNHVINYVIVKTRRHAWDRPDTFN